MLQVGNVLFLPEIPGVKYDFFSLNSIIKLAKKRKKAFDTRIEPVGKPYREVCLRSEFWDWMAHQSNSWSKHPGTQIEQVLAYCRDEKKYVGCIELLFCLTVTMTFGVRT